MGNVLTTVLAAITETMDTIELVSNDASSTDKNTNPFLVYELQLLKALMQQAPHDQTRDEVSYDAVQTLKGLRPFNQLDIKALAIEHTTTNLNKLYLLSEDIPYSWENECTIKHLLNGNLEHFFNNYFESMEGDAFSHDKSVHVINAIEQELKTNTEVPLYSEYDFGKGLVEAYWSPKTIQTSKEALHLFYEAYHSIGTYTK